MSDGESRPSRKETAIAVILSFSMLASAVVDPTSGTLSLVFIVVAFIAVRAIGRRGARDRDSGRTGVPTRIVLQASASEHLRRARSLAARAGLQVPPEGESASV